MSSYEAYTFLMNHDETVNFYSDTYGDQLYMRIWPRNNPTAENYIFASEKMC
jgi:hypothetical protein